MYSCLRKCGAVSEPTQRGTKPWKEFESLIEGNNPFVFQMTTLAQLVIRTSANKRNHCGCDGKALSLGEIEIDQ